MKINNSCTIIGVLDNAMQGLTLLQQEKIQQADIIIGATRTLDLFQSELKSSAEIINISGKMMQLPEIIQNALAKQYQIVVLATGDPLCHGIGAFLVKKLGRNKLTILANLSMLQVAFAHLGESWHDAKICSIHSKDTGEWSIGADPQHGLYDLLRTITEHDLLAVYTSPENSPQRIARMLLLENRSGQYEFFVFENLLQENQTISLNLSLENVVQGDFSGLNLVVIRSIKKLENHAPETILFGHQDDFYAQRKPEKGLITRCDVRAVALAKMQLRLDSIVWDIGAGSGSVGLEAASLCHQGYVYAIEKNCADLELIETNRQRMQLINYSVVCAKAPDKMADWPSPDAVFIGGSAGQLRPLLAMIFEKLRPGGALVMNFITLENLSETIEILKSLDLEWQLTQLQTSHSKPILHMNRLQADNLVWIVSVHKEI